MIKGHLRGHKIIFDKDNDEWVYEDTKEPTAGNKRACGYCGKANTIEGHDGCLGVLPNVLNACCGHGKQNEAYVIFVDNSELRGDDALNYFLAQNSL